MTVAARSSCRGWYWRHSSEIALVGELLLLVLVVLRLASADDAFLKNRVVLHSVMAYAIWLAFSQFAAATRGMSQAFLEVRTWAMVLLLVWTMWHTDGLASPLRNGVLAVMLISALTTSKANALLATFLLSSNTAILVHLATNEKNNPVALVFEALMRISPLMVLGYLLAICGPELRFRLLRRHFERSWSPITGLISEDGLVIELAHLHGAMPRNEGQLCVLILTVRIADTALPLQAGHIEPIISLLAANIFQELGRGDIAASCGADSILILLSHAVPRDCVDLERRLRESIDVDSIRTETGVQDLDFDFIQLSWIASRVGIDAILSDLDRALNRNAG